VVEKETGPLENRKRRDNGRKLMVVQSHFHYGQPIVLRIISQGRIWEARPEIVVQDTPELLVFYMPPGTICKDAYENIRPAKRAATTWSLRDVEWHFGGKLRLSIPGENYSVIILRNLDNTLRQWYVNLEEPLKRSRLGFDYSDQILDMILTPDLSRWRWEDEDELDEAVSTGLITKKESTNLYAKGNKVITTLQSGKSIFNGWENWQPDPAWPVPVLPGDWNII